MKLIKKIKHNHKLQIILIQITFVILAIAFTITSIIQNRVAASNDTIFNYQRMMEVFKQLSHFKIPQFNLYTSLPYGRATPSMYPWMILIPFTPLSWFIHNPVLLWQIIVSIEMLVGFEVAFYSFKTCINKNLNAWLFAIIYALSTIEFSSVIASSDISSFYATLLVPLVIFGWLQWIRHGYWKMMTCGLILIFYTHVLTTVITIISLIILTIVCGLRAKHKGYKLLQLLKGIISFILATCIVWCPIIIMTRNNSMAAPGAMVVKANNMFPIVPNSPSFIVAPFLFRVWTYSDLVALILALIYWKRISKLSKKFVLISLGYILVNVKWIKMFLITKTPLSQIQFMSRINFISHLLLSYVIVEIIVNILLKRWYIQNTLALLITLFILSQGGVVLSDLDVAKIVRYPARSFPELVKKADIHSMKTEVELSGKVGVTVFNNKDMELPQFLHYDATYDYIPIREAQHYGMTFKGELANHHAYYVYPQSNGRIKFHLRQNNRRILIPMTMYRTQKYHIKLDKHPANWQFNKKFGCVQLNHLKAGWHTAQIQIPVMNYRYRILVVSLIGLGLLLVLRSKRPRRRIE